VLLNAELLAGLTLAQLAKEGTPVILGSLPAYLDMKGMGSFYDPISYVLNLACAEIMAWYQIPHCGTSGSGMGWGPDLITSGHQWINHLTSCIGKVGLAPFVGDSLGSKALSPATLVYANEVIAQARRFAQGFSLASASRVVEEIAAVGPGNNYLTSAQTVEQCHSAYYSSDVFAQLTYESWLAQGHPKAMERLRSYTQQLLNDLRPLRDHDELVENGECFIREGLARLP
jgi:trimethylamine--corrinoid protein Co-methyltransferase